MLRMHATPGAIAARQGWAVEDVGHRLTVAPLHERRALGSAWAEATPDQAIAHVVEATDAQRRTSELYDQGITIAPLDAESVLVTTQGAAGLRSLAALPDAVAAATRELVISGLKRDDATSFVELVDPARFSALRRLEVAGQAAVADAAMKLVGEATEDVCYRARGMAEHHVAELARRPLTRVALFGLDDDAVLPLLSLETLEHLELTYCPFPRKHLKELAKLPALVHLTLAQHDLTKANTKQIAAIEGLRSLDLRQNETPDDASWARLGELPHLTALTLQENRVGPKTLAALAALELRRLDLSKCENDAWGGLGELATLEELDLTSARLDAEGWAALERLEALRTLRLSAARPRGASLEALTGASRLVHLELARGRLTADELRPLAEVPSLRELSLDRNPDLGAAALDVVGTMPLSALEVSGCGIDDARGLEGMRSLEWLSVVGNELRDARPLGALPQLRWLHLGGNPLGASVAELRGATSLIELYAQQCEIGDAIGSLAAALPNLRRLFAWGNAIGDEAVEALSRAASLRIANLVGNPLSPAAQERLTSALPHCTFEW